MLWTLTTTNSCRLRSSLNTKEAWTKCILISLFLCSSFISSSRSQRQFSPSKQEVKTYAFEYLVNDEHKGTKFGRKEQSDGNKVQGVYNVNLPDGRHQTVHYEVEDDTGFRASVTYDSEAKFSPKIEKANKTKKNTPKIPNLHKSSSAGAIPVPILIPMSDHKPKIILKRPNTFIKTVATSKPGIVQNILSSIKQFSGQFTENLNGLNQNKPHKANPKPVSNISPAGHGTPLTVIKPEAPKASLPVSHHPRKKIPKPSHHIRTTKRSTSHGNKQHRPQHTSLQLPSVYNTNTEPVKGPESYQPADTNYSPDIDKPPPDRPTPKYRPYRPPSCLGCG